MEVILAKLLQPDSDVIKQVHGFLRRKDSNGLERETDRGTIIKMQATAIRKYRGTTKRRKY